MIDDKKRITISFSNDFLHQIDKNSSKLDMTRCSFIRLAILEYMNSLEKE